MVLTGAHNPFSVKIKKKRSANWGEVIRDHQCTQVSLSCFYSCVEVHLHHQERPECTFSWVCWPPMTVGLAMIVAWGVLFRVYVEAHTHKLATPTCTRVFAPPVGFRVVLVSLFTMGSETAKRVC